MRIKTLVLLFIASSVIGAVAQTNRTIRTRKWSDSTRDVYIAGEIDRDAQVLLSMSSSFYSMALISGKFDRAIILDIPVNTVSTMAKDEFHFSADRASATSDGGAPNERVCDFTQIDSSTYLFTLDGKSVLIGQHGGFVGEMSEQTLWKMVPVWLSLMESYKPNPEAVAAIKASKKDATITLVLGTWCSDSKRQVPRILKALRATGNNYAKLKLIGVDSRFQNPLKAIQDQRIINVPTIIVERGGREVGRIVETPASHTVEEDLAAILDGKPNVHEGREERREQIASGTYIYRDRGGKERGREEWILYSNSSKGYLLHSRIETGDLKTEIFHRVDAGRQTAFVEITNQLGDDLMRARYNVNGNRLTARLRGNKSGVIQQTLAVPNALLFSSSAIAAEGWAHAAGRPQKIVEFTVPRGFEGTAGTLSTVSYQPMGEETVRVPAGEFRARHSIRKTGESVSEWWTHQTLGIPVRGKVAGGMEYILTSLKLSVDDR